MRLTVNVSGKAHFLLLKLWSLLFADPINTLAWELKFPATSCFEPFSPILNIPTSSHHHWIHCTPKSIRPPLISNRKPSGDEVGVGERVSAIQQELMLPVLRAQDPIPRDWGNPDGPRARPRPRRQGNGEGADEVGV
ncbi:hypothetical protein GQ457_04G028590 [Hibiscus cannabinus]